MRNFLPVLVVMGILSFSGLAREPESRVRFQFSQTDIRDVVYFYQRLTESPTFLALDVRGLVTVENTADMPLAAAIEFLRKTLLENHGIELRTTPAGETLVGWSKDPKYPRRTGLQGNDDRPPGIEIKRKTTTPPGN